MLPSAVLYLMEPEQSNVPRAVGDVDELSCNGCPQPPWGKIGSTLTAGPTPGLNDKVYCGASLTVTSTIISPTARQDPFVDQRLEGVRVAATASVGLT